MGAPLPESVRWRTHGDAVVRCRVVTVENPRASNGYPPRVHIHIEQTLRGPKTPKSRLRIVWSAEDDFYAGRSGPEAYRLWLAQPLAPPCVGEHYLVVLEGLDRKAPDHNGPRMPGEPIGATPLPAVSAPAGLRRLWSDPMIREIVEMLAVGD